MFDFCYHTQLLNFECLTGEMVNVHTESDDCKYIFPYGPELRILLNLGN